MKTKTPSAEATEITRNEYGAIDTNSALSPEQKCQLQALVDEATKSGNLPRPYITSTKRDLECLNLDTYDVLIFRGKVKGLVIQARTFWKNLRKGYTRSQKSYFVVLNESRKISVTKIDSSTCVKRAKNTLILGQLVNHYLGKTKVKCKSSVIKQWAGYKILAKDTQGALFSAFDGSEYLIGQWRIETVQPDHGGGYYYYRDQALAVEATSNGTTFSARVSSGKALMLCEVEVSGREIAYSGGKFAASKIRIVREMQMVDVHDVT